MDPVDNERAEGEVEEKTGVIRLAEMISHAAGIGSPEGYPTDIATIMAQAKFVGFPAEDLESLIEKIINETQEKFNAERHIYE